MSVHVDKSLRLPESEYFPGPRPKSGIAIHHTVGGSARSTFHWWLGDKTADGRPNLVATAYLIDTDGTVFEVFDPAAWAYQFGLSWTAAQRLKFEQRFIGIELASEGALIEQDDTLYCFDRVSPKTVKPKEQAFDCGSPWRGHRWFDRYEDAQLTALGLLVDELCTRFAIPRQYPEHPFDFYGDRLAGFSGIIGHAMVRLDKSDPAPDPRLWISLASLASVKPSVVNGTAPAGTAGLTSLSQEALFTENMRRIDAMDPAAGSLVKALVLELERRRYFVQLAQPAPGAHAVGYMVLQGDRHEIRQIAKALGFATVTEELLAVRHA
jgi:hypothetical protein